VRKTPIFVGKDRKPVQVDIIAGNSHFLDGSFFNFNRGNGIGQAIEIVLMTFSVAAPNANATRRLQAYRPDTTGISLPITERKIIAGFDEASACLAITESS
jgi:hypothetical protein